MSLLASLLLSTSLHGSAPAAAPPADSIGQEMRGGQRFVRHRVGQGETLFALSRRYHVSVDQLTAANPQLKSGLGIGQIVLVPRPPAGARAAAGPAKAAAAPPGPAPTAPAAAPARYTVAKGETLFGIARRFGLAPADLLRLNHLPPGGAVRVGQELLLRPAPAASAAPTATTPAPAPARTTTTTPAPAPTIATPAAPPPRLNPAAPAQVATVTPPAPKDSREGREEAAAQASQAKVPARASDLVHRVTENGVAAVIAGNASDKYLALHKTAAVGTIMEVKNQANNQRVYVRVIGVLPATGENDVLVRLSPRAVQKLGTTDARFRVETSYIPYP